MNHRPGRAPLPRASATNGLLTCGNAATGGLLRRLTVTCPGWFVAYDWLCDMPNPRSCCTEGWPWTGCAGQPPTHRQSTVCTRASTNVGTRRVQASGSATETAPFGMARSSSGVRLNQPPRPPTDIADGAGHARSPTARDTVRLWFTVGGGLDEGLNRQEAARRPARSSNPREGVTLDVRRGRASGDPEDRSSD